MHILREITYVVLTALMCVPCVWLPLFLLSWRAERDREHPVEISDPVEHRMPRPRLIHYFTILPVYWLIFFLIWPAFVGARFGRRQR